MPIRVRNKQQEGKDYNVEMNTVVDEDGYQWHFGPNEARVMPDQNTTMASNATVKFGTNVQQSSASEVVADGEDHPARS